ncbi:MAG: ECF-type sigma factor [Planctomycetota bacterium]|nr:ECF-type sigma factor [Planctomycetota bacterium]
MQDDASQTFAPLLARMGDGDEDAGHELFELVSGELRSIASKLMAGERKSHTLQTTALVNEAWMRLAGGANLSAESRGHFVRLASRAMRRVLVDHARKRGARKRQGHRAEPLLDDALQYWDERQTDLLALDEALDRLGERDDDALRVVELRFFSGLTLKEVGAVLGMTERQAGLAWTFARGWLKRELERGTSDA